jgi:hypothetical protein
MVFNFLVDLRVDFRMPYVEKGIKDDMVLMTHIPGKYAYRVYDRK